MGNRYEVESGNTVSLTGYFVYVGSPVKGEIPLYLDKGDGACVLEKGQEAPLVKYGDGYKPAVWRFVVEKKETPIIPIKP